MGEVAAARSSARPIGVGVIGFGWMGRVHSQAYARVRHHYVCALLRLSSGGRVVLEASRVAVGEQNAYGFEVHGTAGALAWDFRRMGELGVSLGDSYQDQSFSTVYVGPGAGYYAAFQPGAGNAMGYDDLKVIEAHEFLQSIAEGHPHGTNLQDAVRAAEVLDALADSAETGSWVGVPAHSGTPVTGAWAGRP